VVGCEGGVFFWFLVFGLLCPYTASNTITAGMHTRGIL